MSQPLTLPILPDLESRLRFFECLAHDLTVSVRGVWSASQLSAEEKVHQMRIINEILHQITAKVRVLRLQTHEWTDQDSEADIRAKCKDEPHVTNLVDFAIRHVSKVV